MLRWPEEIPHPLPPTGFIHSFHNPSSFPPLSSTPVPAQATTRSRQRALAADCSTRKGTEEGSQAGKSPPSSLLVFLILMMHPSVPLRKSQILFSPCGTRHGAYVLLSPPTQHQIHPFIQSINRHTCNSMLLVAHLHLHFKLGLVFTSDQLINLSRDRSTVCTNKCS